MKRDRISILLGILALGPTACGSGENPPPGPPLPATTSGSGQGGAGQGGAGQGGAGQGGAGQGGAGQGGGGTGATGGGGGSSATCGNAMLEPGEACEGMDLGGKTCLSAGFDTGTLSCHPDCTLDTSACSGVEKCQDGADNDGDASIDCMDSDCTAACVDACTMPPLLPDPSYVSGDTSGHAPLAQSSSCSSPDGPAVVYAFTASATGFLDVELSATSAADFSLSVRSTCADGMTEIACANNFSGIGETEKISTTPINQNDTVYVVISGADASQAGTFALLVKSRTPACGDAIQDPAEECDDANAMSGDGCSGQCTVETTEVEPNNATTSANPYSTPFYALISPAGDADVVAITVPSGPASLIADTEAITVEACADLLLDNYIDILDTTGTVTLASDDDGGTGYCARAIAPNLSTGIYYVRVGASTPGGIFPYRLDLTLIQDVCGDGTITPSEQCDDGGTVPGDGCSATCQFEISETEPNNVPAQADTFASPWLANISPAGDVDYVAVTAPGPSSTLTAATADHGTGACNANALDSVVEILGTDGSTVLAMDDDSGPGYCSIVTKTGLAAGMYYLRIHPAALVPNATFLYELNVTVQ
jgi:cysteine-rich repeat protein